MKPERWQQVDELFHAALALEPAARAAFLDHACKDDPALRRDVESLIASHDSARSFISSPAVEAAAPLLADDKTDSLVQLAIGPYRILSRIGAGGMGEVYLARDSRLARKVALKLLPDYFTRDEQPVKRFKQEAQAASALNHPNIITIHDIGQAEGRHFIATEFVEGETLRKRLANGRMSLSEALDVAAQVASALSAAHQSGIVHRDIKPENIMLRPDGIVKVLDFGLAKLTERRIPGVDTEALTVDTAPGTVMGTASYMSPEQARGREVDARTDIFSLGVVLYEMLAGRLPFKGETASDVIASILEKEPVPLSHHSPEAPAELQWIVSKGLRKEREDRYQTVREMLSDLKEVKEALQTQARLERSQRPEASTAMGVATGSGQAIARTAHEPIVSTGEAAAARTTSSAEYLISAIKPHKRGALIGVALLALATAVAVYVYFNPEGKTINSLAVLPFVNASDDANSEYLSDGIAESLINSISQLSNVKVMSRNSVFRYKGKETDAQAAGKELGVQAVLTGRVTPRGDSLSISVELVDARDNSHIWGEQYNRKLSDILAVQGEISKQITEKLRLRLTGQEQKLLAKRYTDNVEAYQLYLKGRYFWSKVTEEEIKKGTEYFQQAINLDPNYALAYAGLAISYEALASFFGFQSPQEFFLRSKAAAMKALEIDETLAEAHTALANYRLMYEWDWPGAEREYRRAIELNPNYAHAHQAFGLYFEALERFDEAIASRKRAQELDPLTPSTVADVGYPLYYARRHDQAIEHFRRALELDPNFSWSYLWIGQAYVQKRMYEEAITEIKKAITLLPDNPRAIATLGHAYAVSGKRGEARKVLDELYEQSKRRYVSPYFIAVIHTGLGEKGLAFTWLEKAREERHPYLTLLKVEPVFDGLRSDPRFRDLLRRVGLPV